MYDDFKALTKELASDYNVCVQNEKHFSTLVSKLNDPDVNVDKEKALKACAVSLRHTNALNQKLISIIFTMVSSISQENKQTKELNDLYSQFTDLFTKR